MRPNEPKVTAYEARESHISRSEWDPRSWSRRIWLILVTIIIIIVVAIVATVVGVRATRNSGNGKDDRYPNYTRLNYTLVDTYSGTSFFDKFDYFNTYDPAGGFVHYVSPGDAKLHNLTYATESTVLIRVDTSVGPGSEPDASTGRFSVRLESKTQYGPGLFLFDVRHTPYGCATWPALWLTDPNNWPTHGEIDIMEAVNQANSGNMVALHTTAGCDMSDIRRSMTGTAGQGDCHNATNSNTGCIVLATSPATYGPAFNAAGGGIVALEWRNEGIRVWVFSRNGAGAQGLTALPAAGETMLQGPDTQTWGPPLADFPATNCDMARHFRNQSIIVNIDLCGYLTEARWADSGCSKQKCTDFVANNPSAFTDAYWEFGGFQVYSAS
ncbi:glycoside hydrolase family 16 protein [Chaetomium strumarium]|uniref:Glycoside hydrolase family 16 protein n=1 Tax=Chaetomium strumarium TaxID=1170767 RepID=A0AAJ0M475_9PEZI|nr:glycoside hydrolase family 16 protein [Chaetomium strumarium]